MKFDMIFHIILTMGALVSFLPMLAVGETSGNGETSGVGGNVAGSIITIPTQSPVPFNESCVLNTYLFKKTEFGAPDLGVYCNSKNL